MTVEGLLRAARSLKSFVYHPSSDFEKDGKKGPNVGDREIGSVLSKYTANSLKEVKTLFVESWWSLSIFQRLEHLCVPLDTYQADENESLRAFQFIGSVTGFLNRYPRTTYSHLFPCFKALES